MTASVSDILRSSRFFAKVQGPSFDRLVAMASLQRFGQGEVIFRQGDPCPGVYVVGSGAVKIYQLAPSGKEHVIHLVEPGLTFAEVAAIGGFGCPAFAEATAKSVCVLLPTESFNQALRDDHELCLQIMGSMTLWVRRLVDQLQDIVLRDAAGRLARHLLDVIPDDETPSQLPGLKKDLASHLNLTSETLSRTLRRLERAGLIERVEQARLRILRRDDLAALADGVYPTI